ncbi:L-arginine-binding protein-like [Glandiceps talaboti]
MAEQTGYSEFQADSNTCNFQIPSDKSRMVNDGYSNGSNRLIQILITLVAVVAIVALVIAILGFTRKSEITVNGSNLKGAGASITGDDERIWTFAIGHSGQSLEYIDENGGLSGFNVDIINAVCAAANKNCRIMADLYVNCWDSKAGQWPIIGVGLADRWYDACTGWLVTYNRLRTVDFTHAFSKSHPTYFYVKSGNPGNFNWRNLTGKKIAIGDGWASDEYCIKRNSDKIAGIVMASDMWVHYITAEAAEQAVLDGEVDAAFFNSNMFASTTLTPISDEITNCMKDGAAMMFRKDNPLASWWNPAFDRLKESSQYRQICEDANKNHGHMPGKIMCVD